MVGSTLPLSPPPSNLCAVGERQWLRTEILLRTPANTAYPPRGWVRLRCTKRSTSKGVEAPQFSPAISAARSASSLVSCS